MKGRVTRAATPFIVWLAAMLLIVLGWEAL